MDSVEEFTAQVQLDGVNPFVDVPDGILLRLGEGPGARVLVRVAPEAGAFDPRGVPARDAERLAAIGRLTPAGWFRTTLVPRREMPARLYLDGWMRAVGRVGVEDIARVQLQIDREDRALVVPESLREALEGDEEALAAWTALAPSRRREILTYLNFLKTEPALERNVRKMVDDLRSKPGRGQRIGRGGTSPEKNG